MLKLIVSAVLYKYQLMSGIWLYISSAPLLVDLFISIKVQDLHLS